jgi:hypothetical protein
LEIKPVSRRDRFLFISDLQIPFEAINALPFVKAVAKEFKIPQHHIYNVGDEVDQYWGGLWDKDPNAHHTVMSEIEDSLKRLKLWYKAFPDMKLATSNHGQRWAKRAAKAGIPSAMMRRYQELLESPPGWVWRDHWTIKTYRPIHMFHGCGYGGMYAYRQAAVDKGMNTVFGHLHSNAGIAPVVTDNTERWGMNVGCLIDPKAYAFHYGKDTKFKPWLGVGVVVDGGMTPILVPYERW